MKDLILSGMNCMGLQLGVDDAELEVIEKNNRGDLRACQRNVFSTWLRITRSPSYQPLVATNRGFDGRGRSQRSRPLVQEKYIK